MSETEIKRVTTSTSWKPENKGKLKINIKIKRDDEILNEGTIKNNKTFTNISTSRTLAGSRQAGVIKIGGTENGCSGTLTPSTSRGILGYGRGEKYSGEVGRDKAGTRL